MGNRPAYKHAPGRNLPGPLCSWRKNVIIVENESEVTCPACCDELKFWRDFDARKHEVLNRPLGVKVGVHIHG